MAAQSTGTCPARPARPGTEPDADRHRPLVEPALAHRLAARAPPCSRRRHGWRSPRPRSRIPELRRPHRAVAVRPVRQLHRPPARPAAPPSPPRPHRTRRRHGRAQPGHPASRHGNRAALRPGLGSPARRPRHPPHRPHLGFPLGRWLATQRHQANLHRDLFDTPWPHGEHLARIDPYWNPPWGMKWQRRYQAARTQLTPGQNLAPEEGFPGTPDWTGQWLYSQCAVYDDLHPRQQQLLADLGLTAEGARTARPRRKTQAASFAAGLAHARAWAQQHGNLAVPEPARHDGYRLGTWLRTQRRRASRGKLPADRIKALEAIDPHWNPAGGLRWQQAYLTARTHTTGRSLTTTADLDALPSATAKWLFTQCSSYGRLHPEQQQLLAETGLTSERAHVLAPPPKPSQPPCSVRPRLKNPPSSFNAGLPYARAWAAQHGNLTSACYRTEHDGFPLGRWLYKQRRAAHDHLKRTGNTWLHDPQLTALDPWWNPPWRVTWNHSWHLAHTHYTAAQPFPNNTIKWIRTQQRAWAQLHPHQQHLMIIIGIHGPTPLCRYNSRPAILTDQPTELINIHETSPRQESRSSQARPGPARKQRHTPRQHPPHRRTQPAN
ncbi:hypothetical protein CNQ36_34370 (plasmid) [Streptomyces fungicidicus]|uniref:Helicase-associated domain-containing protein n=1 Tax=Streptomyces fungicidicus TaxID=68203 RepID=A0A494VA79_9ACTN|nr:hypothetical protein CNQ36_34370 [Streptomyces fungicidicus]